VSSARRTRGIANPIEVVHLAALPRTASGKINRKDLAGVIGQMRTSKTH
jgi:acyl-coenzyme A synthetase/AMP-(fatty) acid ligase